VRRSYDLIAVSSANFIHGVADVEIGEGAGGGAGGGVAGGAAGGAGGGEGGGNYKVPLILNGNEASLAERRAPTCR
jgi:hypothetical protein